MSPLILSLSLVALAEEPAVLPVAPPVVPVEPAPPAEPPAAPEPAPLPVAPPVAPAPPVAAPLPVAPPPTLSPWERPPREHRARTPHAPIDDHVEVGVELGSVGIDDRDWSLFSANDAINSAGLRVGVRAANPLVVYADWQRDRVGNTLEIGNEEYDYDYSYYYDGSGGAASSFGSHQLTLGAKLDTTLISEWIRPYATVGVVGVLGTARFDDDVNDPESPGQVAYSGAAVGGIGALGASLRYAPLDAPVALHFWFEAGYAAITPMKLDDFGELRPGGLAIRSGVGVIF